MCQGDGEAQDGGAHKENHHHGISDNNAPHTAGYGEEQYYDTADSDSEMLGYAQRSGKRDACACENTYQIGRAG